MTYVARSIWSSPLAGTTAWAPPEAIRSLPLPCQTLGAGLVVLYVTECTQTASALALPTI
jgi:hypothetical protein